jgi:hypothetical protein
MNHVIHGASDLFSKRFMLTGLYRANDSAQGYVFLSFRSRRLDGVLLAKLRGAITRQSD